MLLRQVLDTAGLVKDGQDGNSVSSPSKSLAILDVGFGCGDQTWELVRLTRAASHWSRFRYVGLTMNQFQVGAAERRIYRETLSSLPRSSSSSSPRQQQHSPVPVPPADSFTLFCANAALPDAWKPNVKRAIQSMTETGDAGNDGSDGPAFSDRWFLALDCLYHFSPSRMPILRYAAKTLAANFMAFDLVLNDAASWKDVLKVRAIGVMMGCPFHTFLTEAQYTEQLIHCGYDKGSIIIRDISPQVFPGVVRFLEDQDRALSQYGISIGGFKLAGRLFDWFGRSKVVKASIVVARVAR